MICKISGLDGGDYEQRHLLVCSVALVITDVSRESITSIISVKKSASSVQHQQ
jgi:hypothetical protein